MKLFWEGDIREEKSAWALLSLLNQIYEWARETHRLFVEHHLRKWNTYYTVVTASRARQPAQHTISISDVMM
jgi:hypothetical protein